ncbi:uncharacterized protein LOC129609668 isoform X2 [Condylostylus longicornis]|uniref:uncharacterized protein LOC129609668 isoform X2 n=1 Tax=Condylostylus longicornis TaxID=2530218 RepID=UPI00244DC0F7|nr:uncharacterized protein LOC129609668 isoform X2 [Condylostylus longicornis]
MKTEATSEIKEAYKNSEMYLKNLLENGEKEYPCEDEMQLPEWHDEKITLKGQSYLNKYRLIIFNGMLSGLIAVMAIPSILKILIATKQSSTPAMSYRRYVRTILHTISFFRYPLKPGTKSWESLEMVRKAHFKSSHIADKQNCGKITQKDLALTQFGFMAFYCLEADSIGLADEEFKSSTIHLWRLIGYLLGIKDEYNICTSSWDTTKERLDLIMRNVYKPALENTSEEFNEMTKTLIDGLWPLYHMLNWETSLYFTKHSAKCANYEYYETDDFGGEEKFKEFYKLGWYNRFKISSGIFLAEKLYKIKLFRIFFNFRLWTYEIWSYYFPYFPIYKFGLKWAYVRIYNNNEESMNLHMD